MRRSASSPARKIPENLFAAKVVPLTATAYLPHPRSRNRGPYGDP